MVMSTFLAWLLVNPIMPLMDAPRDARPCQAAPAPAMLEPAVFATQASPLPCVHDKDTCPTACRPESAPMITRVYQVADLVVPIQGTPSRVPTTQPATAPSCPTPCVTGSSQQPQHTTEDRLMALIRTQVAPASWAEKGGPAAMDYYPLGMSLIVRQSAACHARIAELLQSLRRTQDTQVVVEVRMIAVPDCFTTYRCNGFFSPVPTADAKTTGGVFTPDLSIPWIDLCCANPAVLDDKSVRSILNVYQADPRTHLLMMPRLTVFNGQEATIAATEQQYFVTEITKTRHKDQVLQVPHNQAFTTGMKLHVQPVVSADRRYVKMKLSIQDTELAVSPPPMSPVTMFVTPEFEGGSQGQPIPFTQYVQHPTFEHHQIDRTLTVPAGQTAVLVGWKKKCPAKPLVPEVLRDLPFLSCLFLNACPAESEMKTVLVLVTPRVLTHEETELKAPARMADACPKETPVVQAVYEEPPQASVDARLHEILASYQAACARGDRAAATQWAVQALALEPTCFGKKTR